MDIIPAEYKNKHIFCCKYPNMPDITVYSPNNRNISAISFDIPKTIGIYLNIGDIP